MQVPSETLWFTLEHTEVTAGPPASLQVPLSALGSSPARLLTGAHSSRAGRGLTQGWPSFSCQLVFKLILKQDPFNFKCQIR